MGKYTCQRCGGETVDDNNSRLCLCYLEKQKQEEKVDHQTCDVCKGKGYVGMSDKRIRIVGLIGNIGVGKTTAAKYLQNQGYIRLRFADRLKAMLRTLGLSEREIDGDLKACPCEILGGQTPRHAMITLGTEWGRNMIHPGIWVNALERELAHKIGLGVQKFVIDDFRFFSEAEWFHGINKYFEKCLIRIVRGDNTKVLNHQSETEQSKIVEDWTIYNNDTVESMYKSIDESLEHLFKSK